MTLQEKLTTLRKQKGLSQDALADKLYVSRQAVYKWESGQATPDIDKLRVLSSLYNVSIDNLLNDKEEIKYVNAPTSEPKAYGKVIRKKELRGKEADVHNLMLLPDEQKQHAARKKALKTFESCFWTFLVLAFLSLAGAVGWSFIFLGLAIAMSIMEKRYKKKHPSVELSRTYYRQELAKAEALLKSKFDTVIRLQDDLLAWFVYSHKDKTIGFYFDGEYQFLCPLANFAAFEVSKSGPKTYFATTKYFEQDGKFCKYQLDLFCMRKYDLIETNSMKKIDYKEYQRFVHTGQVLDEIKTRLEVEKRNLR